MVARDVDVLGTANVGEIGMGQNFTDIGDGLPLGVRRPGDPGKEVGGCIGMFFRVIKDAAFGDDSYAQDVVKLATWMGTGQGEFRL